MEEGATMYDHSGTWEGVKPNQMVVNGEGGCSIEEFW